MAQVEELLQELIALQKEEMRRTRRYRVSRILLGTLPTLIFLGLTIWGSLALYQNLDEVFKNLPSILQEQGLPGLTTRF